MEQDQMQLDEVVKHEADHLVNDLLAMLRGRVGKDDLVALIEDLCIYIVARDRRVMIHGYNVGIKCEV